MEDKENFDIIKKGIIEDIGENERSEALIEFLKNEGFGIRQIGHDSYNYTVNNSDNFIRTESDFTSDMENETPVLHLIIPDTQSNCGKFYVYDKLSEASEDLIMSRLWEH
jgi:hypothetical protein